MGGRSLQKCPACGAINGDKDDNCGVCGADLSRGISIDEQSLDKVSAPQLTGSRHKLNWTALGVVLTGPLLALLGLVLLLNLLSLGSDLLSLAGLGLLMVGLLLITFTVGYGPSFWRYRICRYRRFPPDYGSHDPRPREVEQEEAMQADASDEERDQVEESESKEERKRDRYD